jgi:hypothetical protein
MVSRKNYRHDKHDQTHQTLNALIMANGIYKEKNKHLAVGHEKVPMNIRLFQYNFHNIDYDNYYLSRVFKKSLSSSGKYTLFFVNKNTGKMFKKELIPKEFSPGEILPKGNEVLTFNNVKHMMDVDSFIIHPNGVKQDFHNNGKQDPFIIKLDELLNQMSKQYAKLFPDEVIEVHLSAHINGGKWRTNDAENVKGDVLLLYDGDDNANTTFTTEELQNMENMLKNDFIVTGTYVQSRYVSDLALKTGKTTSKVHRDKTFFTKFRASDKRLHTRKRTHAHTPL